MQRKGASEHNCPFVLVGRVGCTTQRLRLTIMARQVATRIPLAKILKTDALETLSHGPTRHSGGSPLEPQAPAQTPELSSRGFRRPSRFLRWFKNSPGGLLRWPSGQFLCHRVSRPNLRRPPGVSLAPLEPGDSKRKEHLGKEAFDVPTSTNIP